MPTVLRIGNLRVVIYPNDHRPAHVHVIGPEHEALFHLNCPAGPVDLRENYGFSTREIIRIIAALTKPLRSYAPPGRRYMATLSIIEKANRRAAARKASTPIATAARYDRKSDRIILSLNTNLEIMFSPKNAQGRVAHI